MQNDYGFMKDLFIIFVGNELNTLEESLKR